MKKLILWAGLLLWVGVFGQTAWAGDTITEVRKKGVLVAGVKDSTPGFGFYDKKTREIAGYDVDFCRYIAKKLGVRLVLSPVTSTNRVPELLAGNIDIIAATMTKNDAQANRIVFSYSYFMAGQKFMALKGNTRKMADLDGKVIATVAGSMYEQNTKKALHKATVLVFDDYLQAFMALQKGKVAAVTADESILVALLATAPDRYRFEISPFRVSDDPYGLGMRNGNPEFVRFVNSTLLEMEQNGEAKRIFNKWFGPKHEISMNRGTFRITVGR